MMSLSVWLPGSLSTGVSVQRGVSVGRPPSPLSMVDEWVVCLYWNAVLFKN